MSWFSEFINDISGRTEADAAYNAEMARRAEITRQQQAQAAAEQQRMQQQAAYEQQVAQQAQQQEAARQQAIAAEAERQRAEAAEAERVRVEKEQAEAARQGRIAAGRSRARSGATESARQYFTGMGVSDINPYAQSISAEIERILGGISPDEENAEQYFGEFAPTIYNKEQNLARERSLAEVNRRFAPSFENQLVPDTADDQIIADILAGARTAPENMIQNMLRRGVINEQGAGAARGSLAAQEPNIRTQLDLIGEGAIGSGREALRGIAERARSDASARTLGGSFDVGRYGSEVDTKYSEVLSKLGDRIRSSAGSDDLFDTSNLASIAGSAQGAGNFKFDPAALAGIRTPPKEGEQQEDEPQKEERKKFF